MRCTPEGVEYEADQRHAEIAIRQLDVEEGNMVITPYDETNDGKTEDAKGRNHQDLVDDETATIYKSVAARLNYLSPDRPDIQFAVKEVCRRMSCPTWLDYGKLKRIGRYLVGKPRLVLKFEFQGKVDQVTVQSDTNWAGCRDTRKTRVEDVCY